MVLFQDRSILNASGAQCFDILENMSPSRGVLYLVWGEAAREEMRRSIASLDRFGLVYRVMELDAGSKLTAKSGMYRLSPFDETLFLDTDTVLLEDPVFGFEMAERHGVAMAIEPDCWAHRQWAEASPKKVTRDIPEYNTGVVFFTRDFRTELLFNKWSEIAGDYGDADQWSFAQAVYETGFNPFILPSNWNFRDSVLYGPIKVWHARNIPPPRNIEEWNLGPVRLGRIEDNEIFPVDWRQR